MSVNYGRPNEQERLREERETMKTTCEGGAGDRAAARATLIHSHISDHTSSIVTHVTLLGPTHYSNSLNLNTLYSLFFSFLFLKELKNSKAPRIMYIIIRYVRNQNLERLRKLKEMCAWRRQHTVGYGRSPYGGVVVVEGRKEGTLSEKSGKK